MMKAIFNAFSEIKYFLGLSFVFILIGIITLTVGNKIPIHLYINNFHTPFFDIVFEYITYLGDGIFAVVLLLIVTILYAKRERLYIFLLGLSTLLLTGIFAQFLKRVVFPNAMRPRKFIGDDLLYLIPGLDVHTMNSFPSGHTTAAFALFAFLSAVLFKKSIVFQFLIATTAILIGYSRMYLSQHFLEDVVTGAIIGLLAYLIARLSLNKLKNKATQS